MIRLESMRTLNDTLRAIDAGTEVWCVTGPVTGPAPAGRCHLVVTSAMLDLIRRHLLLVLDREGPSTEWGIRQP